MTRLHSLLADRARRVLLVAVLAAGAFGGPVVGLLNERLQRRVEAVPGVTAGGAEIAGEQIGAQVGEDLARAEMLAFPTLFTLPLLVFRGLVAALLPLAVGLATILVTFPLVRLVNAVEPMSVFAGSR